MIRHGGEASCQSLGRCAPAEPPKAATAPAKPVMAGIPPSKIAPAAPAAAPAPEKNSQDDIDAMLAAFDSPAPAPAAAAAPEPEADDEVFELTEQMAVPAGPPASFQRVEPDDDLEFTETQVPPPVSPSVQRFDPPVYDTSPRPEILAHSTVNAVESAFNALANTVLSNNARTLEDLVKEMLRPMLKSWLDDNLPNLVERIVRAEIERVSRGR